MPNTAFPRRILPTVARSCGALACGALLLGGVAAAAPETPPRPDDRPADLTKPVQVYLLLGQSNMLGFGKVKGDAEGTLEHATGTKGLYPYLVDDAGAWTTRRDVRLVHVQGSGTGGARMLHDEFLTVKGGKIGPEIGIGHHLGHQVDAPVLLLKSCIGNRSLGWDLLPPGSERYEFDGTTYAGYRESPLSWETDTEPEPIGWYAGMQYDGDVSRAKAVLESLDRHYPGSVGYEIAGFFWWQGDKDRYQEAHARKYEENLVRLIETLRREFEAPNAPFVVATLGQTEKGADGPEGLILGAMLAVDGVTGRHPEFKDTVSTVYTHPLSKGGASNSHYGGHAETYMNVGEAMGRAMVDLHRRGVSDDDAGLANPGEKARTETLRWDVDGVDRTALVHFPEIPVGRRAPLVFVWHGHGGNARQIARVLRIHEHWPEAIVVHPQGLPTPSRLVDPEGRRSGWASGRDAPKDESNRDLRFFDAMLEDLRSRGIVDADLVFSTGHSNGGGFTYLLLQARGDRLAAIAPSSAPMAGLPTDDTARIPIMHLAGRGDDLVKFAWQARTIDAIRRLRDTAPPEPWADHPDCVVHASPSGDLVTYVHDGGHRMPRDAGRLFARFLRDRAEAVRVGRDSAE